MLLPDTTRHRVLSSTLLRMLLFTCRRPSRRGQRPSLFFHTSKILVIDDILNHLFYLLERRLRPNRLIHAWRRQRPGTPPQASPQLSFSNDDNDDPVPHGRRLSRSVGRSLKKRKSNESGILKKGITERRRTQVILEMPDSIQEEKKVKVQDETLEAATQGN